MARKKREYPIQLLVLCPECRGERSIARGCPTCNGFGRVPGLCSRCSAPAFHRTLTTILCTPCYFSCEMCGHLTDPADRIDAGTPHAFLHTFCALTRQILENAVFPDNTAVERSHMQAREQLSARACARTSAAPEKDTMPKASTALIARMRATGYISTTEAAALTGHGLSTLYEWIAAGKVRATRSGRVLHFVHLGDLKKCCPQARAAVQS